MAIENSIAGSIISNYALIDQNNLNIVGECYHQIQHSLLALPNQSIDEAINDLTCAIKLEPNHISWYQLTIEPNTIFFNKPPKLPKEILVEAIQEKGGEILLDAEYKQYEVSAYCKKNKRSAHNMNYWEFGDYLGIGAGAHGKISLPKENKIIRIQKTRSPEDYLNYKKTYTCSSKSIDLDEIPLEFMMNALRINQGVSTTMFEDRTGLSVRQIDPCLRIIGFLPLQSTTVDSIPISQDP